MNNWEIKGKPALVILHMQESIAGSLSSADIAREVRDSDHLPRQQALLAAFRRKNLPVIYVRVKVSQNSNRSIPVYGIMFRAMSQRLESGVENPKMFEIIPQMAPQPGEPVLTNWLLGAFTDSGLDQVLKARGVETLVFCGGALQIAVFNATVQAVDLGYSVIVPEDACIPTKSANKTPEMMKVREVFLEVMLPKYAFVTTTEDVIAHLG